MSTQRTYKRKRFFNYSVKRKLQFRMLCKIWIIVFASLLLAGVIFYYYGNVSVGSSYRLFHIKAQSFLDFLFPVLVVGFFASLVLGAVFALFFPHDFAGPLHRIENELSEIGQGHLNTEIRLRKGSEVDELAVAVNTMTVNLRNQVTKVVEATDEMGQLIIKASPENVATSFQKIKDANERLQEAVKAFQV